MVNIQYQYQVQEILNIIYRFILKNKKIWFVGFKGLKFKNDNISILPTEIILQGLLRNKRFVILNITIKKKIVKFGLSKPDLIIVYEKTKFTSLILKEIKTLHIPFILIFDEKQYPTENNFQVLLSCLLNSIFIKC